MQSPSDFGRKGAQFGTTGIRVSNSISPSVFLRHILVGRVEVQLSRIPANSLTAPAGMNRGATPIIPKGYMWSCPGRVTRPVSVLASQQPPERP